jgi:hypothetical protein
MMSENTLPPASGKPEESRDSEEPITALRELEQDTSPLFLNKIRHKIHRHATASQLLAFSWQIPKIVFVELQSMLTEILSGLGGKTGE